MDKQKQKRKAADQNPLIAALLKLKATGSEGFEGFVRDLLEALTGQRFRLMKSTHQGGVDVLQDGPANRFTLGIEGKKYGEDSPLPLDDLKKKIVDAADSHPVT